MKPKINSLLIGQDSSIKQAMKRMSEVGEKELFIIDGENKLIGALSDGDIRRWILKEGSLEEPVNRICNKQPKIVKEDYKLKEVQELMLNQKIESVPVVRDTNEVKDILIWDNVFAGKVRKHKEKLDIPIIIMAGGRGTRLHPFTKILPKSLMPIGEKPIIELIMDKFNEYDVKDFYISINHKGRMIKFYFEETNKKYNIHYIEEDKPLGSVGSLRLLENKLKGTFLVTNCDVVIDIDHSELVKFHIHNQYDLTMVVSYRHYKIPYGVCEIENGGSLKNIREKPEYDLLVNTGMYVMNDSMLKLIPKNKVYHINDLVEKAKEEGFKIGVFPVNEKSWIDIGAWEEYYKTFKELRIGDNHYEMF